MPTLAEFLSVVERLWPVAGAEAWDAPGPVTGDPQGSVTRVLLAVDAVSETVDEAVDGGFDVLAVHHPLLLRGVTSVAEDRYKGALIAKLIRGGCSLVAAHTNADVVPDGVSDVFAHRLGLVDVRPLVPGTTEDSGLGRVGRMPEPATLGHLARALADLLPPTATGIRVAGDYARPISTVALCGGAGDAFLAEPGVRSADVYITSDLRHHPASEFVEQSRLTGGPALIDVSHWAAEWLWLETAARQLRDALPGVAVEVSELRTDPWDFAVVQ
ncbi:Nif3-like dinuclear metal center hexameric protein [Planctomonas sp. JC2975]|uniref:Nif3-like dinuclear metal center hexameric protein n=1 Tax=Planctomonas sp. JC2975 TaxID=2729626 RepID=UPI001475B1AF|nr:Nif3-like dinuclear metal center hexameric protein [Planctomonas sp. JC2975]NNC10727.1 Nif3-like dinuclear metal center hexameric protein [Planctomonas sp. JC2975]